MEPGADRGLRRWLAAAGFTVATLGAGVGVSSGGLSAAVTQAAAAAAAGASAGQASTEPAGPFTADAAPQAAPLPRGKGMWLNNFDRSAGGDPKALVAQARDLGLTHLYVRLGSSKKGFYAQDVLERLLPVAHAAGVKVVGWDFPTLADPGGDAARAAMEVRYTTASGHRIDAFSADIETPAEGTRLSVDGALVYGAALRSAVGPGYPLIATVPRPSPKRWFPYPEVVASFDAVAPMVYWGKRDPVTDVEGAVAALAPLGKPVMPIGQAYDSAIDGWAGGSPSKDDVARFTQAAHQAGAAAVSYWVWETASAEHWAAIREARQFT